MKGIKIAVVVLGVMLIVLALAGVVWAIGAGGGTAATNNLCDKNDYPIDYLSGNDAAYAYGCIDATHAATCEKSTGKVANSGFEINPNHALFSICEMESLDISGSCPVDYTEDIGDKWRYKCLGNNLASSCRKSDGQIERVSFTIPSGNPLQGKCTLGTAPVATSVTPTAPTAPSATGAPAIITPSANVPFACKSAYVCKEIDEVWQSLSSSALLGISVEKQGKYWEPQLKVWKPFVVAGGGAGGGISTVYSQKIANVALQEYAKWDYGKLKETEPKGKQLVEEVYFKQGTGGSGSVSSHWSAAFVSYVMKQAGVSDFPFSAAHTTYFRKIKEGGSALCHTYPPSDFSGLALGDVLCYCRDDGCPINYNSFPTGYAASHCDILAEKSGSSLGFIGGNVDQTVKKRTRTLSEIQSDGKYFGFIRCGAEAGAGSGAAQSVKLTAPQKEWVKKYAQQEGVEPQLALAIINAESTGDSNAISSTGCSGLMQVCASSASPTIIKVQCGQDDSLGPQQCDLNTCQTQSSGWIWCKTCTQAGGSNCAPDDRFDAEKNIRSGIIGFKKKQNAVTGCKAGADLVKCQVAAYNAGQAIVNGAIKKTGKTAPTWEEVYAQYDIQLFRDNGYGSSFSDDELRSKIDHTPGYVNKIYNAYAGGIE